jgi:hypothetical protein
MRDPIPVHAHLRRATDLIDRGFAERLLTWITLFPLITAIVAITGPLLERLPLAVRLGSRPR